jgi:hypothetical protein
LITVKAAIKINIGLMYSDVARNNKMVKNAYSGKLMLKYVL